MTIHQIFTVSRATTPFDRAPIEASLARWRSSNARLGITGCLLLSGRCFAQVLEGQRATVQMLARRIAADPRHHEVRVLSEGSRAERDYVGWTMGCLLDAGLDDDLETLLMIPQRSAAVAADVLERMRPDPVMGALR
jgi:FAD-dependent sensor of blue light